MIEQSVAIHLVSACWSLKDRPCLITRAWLALSSSFRLSAVESVPTFSNLSISKDPLDTYSKTSWIHIQRPLGCISKDPLDAYPKTPWISVSLETSPKNGYTQRPFGCISKDPLDTYPKTLWMHIQRPLGYPFRSRHPPK